MHILLPSEMEAVLRVTTSPSFPVKTTYDYDSRLMVIEAFKLFFSFYVNLFG